MCFGLRHALVGVGDHNGHEHETNRTGHAAGDGQYGGPVQRQIRFLGVDQGGDDQRDGADRLHDRQRRIRQRKNIQRHARDHQEQTAHPAPIGNKLADVSDLQIETAHGIAHGHGLEVGSESKAKGTA